METRATDLSERRGHMMSMRVLILTIAGGAAFWTINFFISLTPIAAEYRDALSISYFPMLAESFFGGLIVGFFVSFLLLRFYDKVPTRDPIMKSVVLSLLALIVATILLQAPVGLLTPSDGLRYFLIGTLFNVLRILALGIVIGYLYKRLYVISDQSVIASGGHE